MTNEALARPLEGIRVLDLTVALAGPYGSLLLGGLGAEVIRVEAPGGSDIARTNPPFVGARGLHFEHADPNDISLSLLNRARNKKSITLDLKSARGRAILGRLVEHVDVVMENMSDGTAARLGVAYEDLSKFNPRIVYASVSAFGDPSAYPGLKGMDIIVQALSGLMGVTGFADGPPTRCGLPVADLLAPLYAVNGILSALIHRGRTGEGQHVKVSMLDCLASLVAEEHFDVYERAGYALRTGNYHDRLVPFGVYATADGHVAIVAMMPEWFRALMSAIGRLELIEDPRFSARGPRMRHAAEMNALVEAWTRQHTSAEILTELGTKRGIPCAPVRAPGEVLNDPVLRERGAVVELAHPEYGAMGVAGMGLPIQFSRCHAAFDRPAATLGSANAEIYGRLLGIPDQELAALGKAGVI
ncbi:MAG: CoA transferase [Gammaproteobacteria bacterium]|nr:CoA transferase [Gammaproteobacteria bacterium]